VRDALNTYFKVESFFKLIVQMKHSRISTCRHDKVLSASTTANTTRLSGESPQYPSITQFKLIIDLVTMALLSSFCPPTISYKRGLMAHAWVIQQSIPHSNLGK
jgi:hypothetical protein